MKLKNVSKTQVGLIVLCCLVLSTMAVIAQQPNPTQVGVQQQGGNPIYRITVNVVQRTTKAVNYRHRSGATKVDFRGTELLPDAKGEARVESQQGALKDPGRHGKTATGIAIRTGISDLRHVGHYA